MGRLFRFCYATGEGPPGSRLNRCATTYLFDLETVYGIIKNTMKGRHSLSAIHLRIALLLLIFMAGCQKDEHVWSPEDLKSSNYYCSSQRDNREASPTINRAGEVFSIDEKQKVTKLTDDALASARKVDDRFLDKVHPEIKKHFREEFQAALELARQNLDHPDSKSAHRSEELFAAFVDWFNANRDDIHMPPAY